ncbi:mitochondrial ribosomal protein S14 [Phyllostomus discolor]|uniref:Mitochondrial ribosomal protein S14 n=1 Tax=Phyllostomus discolor TaxID=89673 RepID=A0A833YL83_9CHIR|nr:mitochondrial ribosomal protein S14 [Phyllostomus discolor]
MAASMLGSLLRSVRQMVPASASGQVRGYYVDWRMLRDVKRRKMAYEYADERLRINSLRKNTILPRILQTRSWQTLSVKGQRGNVSGCVITRSAAALNSAPEPRRSRAHTHARGCVQAELQLQNTCNMLPSAGPSYGG